MQTDLFLLAPAPVAVTRAMIADWAAACRREWVLLREWPTPMPVTGDPAFSGELLLTWSAGSGIAPRARKACEEGDLSALLRLNYDTEIDGVLFERILPWAYGSLTGMAANLQPHGGYQPLHVELGEWLAGQMGTLLVDPLVGIWSEARKAFTPLDGWRSIAPGALANPYWDGS